MTATESAALVAQARTLAHQNRTEEALEAARRAAAADPANTEAYAYWGVSACELGRFADALEPLQVAAGRMPRGTIGWANLTSQLARAESNVGFWLKACRDADAIDQLPPPDPLIRHRTGVVFARIGLIERGFPHLEWAAQAAPDRPQVLFDLGLGHLTLGRAEEAEALLEQAIAIAPLWTPPHMALASLRRWSAQDCHVDRLRALIQRPELGPPERAEIGFSLFKELDDLGRYDEAWPVLEEANAAARALEPPWSRQEDEALVESLIERFPPGLFAAGRGASGAGERRRPIFVLGLPRSGTTLTERILAAHPAVASLGEAPCFPLVFRAASSAAERQDLTAEVVRATARADWRRIGELYLNETSYLPGTQSFLVDKLPYNCMVIGAIRLALPGAPIVLLRRDPMDTLFSAFRVQFAGVYRWAYRLEDLAEHYAHHQRLMRHWRDCLGEDLIDLHYEALAREPAEVVPRLLDACGLAFDERCLSPEKAAGAVRTASIAQIRRPISGAGIGGWRRYERQLEPLRARLDQLGVLDG